MNRGFTLVELLVTVAIISLLSSIVLTSLNSARAKSRDARRLADIRQIQIALEFYYDQFGQYPPISPDTCNGGWDTGPCGTDPFIGALEDNGFMSRVPVDPGTGNYRYYRYTTPGDNGCDSAKPLYYVLGIADMETSTGPHPESPGWACGARDWQLEFEWVTGAFE